MAVDSRSFDPTSVNPTLRSSLFFNDHYTFFMSLKFKYGINGYFCLIKLGLISFKGKKNSNRKSHRNIVFFFGVVVLLQLQLNK